MGKIISPLSVYISSRKKFTLNLNVYRNAHHNVLAKAKREYASIISLQVRILPRFERVAVEFTLFPATKGRMDTSNICCIHEKFLMDAVVKGKKLPDDDYLHCVKTTYLFGRVDKRNPRVEVKFIAYTD